MHKRQDYDEASVADLSLTDMLQNARAEETIASLKDVFNAMDDGVSLWDEDLKFVLQNDRYKELVFPFGYRELQPGDCATQVGVEVFGCGAYILEPGTDPAELTAEMHRVIRSYGINLELQRTNGRTLLFASKKTALGGYLLTARDITDRKRAEGAKAREMEVVNDAVEALSEGFALYDTDMNFVLCNEKYMETLFPPDFEKPRVGEPAWDITKRFIAAGHLVLPDGMSVDEMTHDLLSWATSFGKRREFALTDGRTIRVHANETKLGGYLITVVDITEERNADLKARDMMRDAVEALHLSVALFDQERRFVFANKAWYDMWFPQGIAPEAGELPEEMIVRQLEQNPGLYHVPDGVKHADFGQGLGQLIEKEVKNFELPMADGRAIIASSMKTDMGGYLLSFKDITGERNAEQKQLKAMTDALNAADYPMVLLSNESTFVLANEAFYKMIKPAGVSPQIGQGARGILSEAIDRGYFVFPADIAKKQVVDAVLTFIHDYEKDYPLETSDGSRYLGSSNRTAMGGYLLSFRDITEQMRTEQELAEQREVAHQNEKLSALGELLAGVAHELNNPLSVVFGYSQMLQDKVKDPILAERIGLICQSAERAAKIVKTFLAMARQRPAKIELCFINHIVATALEVSSYSLKTNGTRVRTEFAEDAPMVLGDFDQLAQVFSNLIVNAGHAVQPKRSAGEILVRSFVRDGQTIVEIRDNGPGIPRDIQKRIFEPFFTTKDVGEGTGVGLAFSHRIVASHDGQLELSSAVGRGTSFFVKLKTEDLGHQKRSLVPHLTEKSSVKNALVVDDEEGVAQLIHDLLVEEGIHVTKSTSPRDALRLASAQHFDLVLSDFKMPDMDGEAFYEAMKVVTPQNANAIGFITGDAMSANVRAFLERSKRPYIEKPIHKDELMRLIERAYQPSEKH